MLVLTEAHDPDLRKVTITDVEMPPDLKSARVYFSCLGGDAEREKAGEALRRAAGYLRREVGRRCELRYAPELFFVSDRSLERGARVEELLHQVLPSGAEGGRREAQGEEDASPASPLPPAASRLPEEEP
jgi:ribosome-binding factor A